jgi:hypothetical protein
MIPHPQFFGSHTWVDDLSSALIDYLADTISPSMSKDRIFLSVWTEDQHLQFPPADRFIALSTPDFAVDQACVQGGGTLNTAFDTTLEVKLFTRVEADLENRSGQYLTEQVAGVYLFAKSVITALQMWPGPTEDAGNGNGSTISKLRRPLRIKPGWKVSGKSSKRGDRWGIVPTMWELSWVADLGDPYP